MLMSANGCGRHTLVAGLLRRQAGNTQGHFQCFRLCTGRSQLNLHFRNFMMVSLLIKFILCSFIVTGCVIQYGMVNSAFTRTWHWGRQKNIMKTFIPKIAYLLQLRDIVGGALLRSLKLIDYCFNDFRIRKLRKLITNFEDRSLSPEQEKTVFLLKETERRYKPKWERIF